jgi:hypothetical protein
LGEGTPRRVRRCWWGVCAERWAGTGGGRARARGRWREGGRGGGRGGRGATRRVHRRRGRRQQVTRRPPPSTRPCKGEGERDEGGRLTRLRPPPPTLSSLPAVAWRRKTTTRRDGRVRRGPRPDTRLPTTAHGHGAEEAGGGRGGWGVGGEGKQRTRSPRVRTIVGRGWSAKKKIRRWSARGLVHDEARQPPRRLVVGVA